MKCENENLPRMMSIREVAGTGVISEHALRQLVKKGKVPCIALEHKTLINFDAFIKMLNNLGGTMKNE